ncbi:ABC transporter permease [Longimicrobium sp.]|uniref:ABC transporter permease n=1 Tax=Longimicrobium sp. TaxID=2029185 RepID=UPI002E30E36A|nr:ABC transporter permease [Longimicrobium sp.]HEX6040338.1 ABC transporter permease [Longimicrobium sp.]
MKTGISWIDLRLGLRMLFKNPGITLVGGMAMAVAIAIGAAMFGFSHALLNPRLPLDEGHRIVAVENRDVWSDNPQRPSLHDFAGWRQELRTIREVSAYRDVTRNLISPDGSAEPVRLAEMSASGFRVARVAPALGRALVEEDEQPGAPPVVVIGHDVWRTRFNGDSRIVGQTVRLGNAVHTVVGVMPEGFAFPVNHDWWIPLRLSPAGPAPGEGPEVFVFGRLAPGAGRDQAQAELDAAGRRAAAAYPDTHADLRPQVLKYTDPAMGVQDIGWEITLIHALISLLLVVVAVNVGVLIYARTATRRGEIAIRTALGASRRRIVAQLFAEALVLASASAVAGLLLAGAGLRMAHAILKAEIPLASAFWLDLGLRPATVLYVMGLTVLAAVISGVLPALGATGRRAQESLRQLGGGTGLRLGRTWTVLIVTQVAFAVGAIPVVLGVAANEMGEVLTRPLFPEDEFLSGGLEMDPDPPAGTDAEVYRRELAAGFAVRQQEVVRRLRAEPWVADVAVGTSLPGLGGWTAIQVERPGTVQGASQHIVTVNRVDGDYLAAFGSTVLAGRGLGAADADTAARTVVVNQAFVRRYLQNGDVLGHRVRFGWPKKPRPGQQEPPPEPWHEIVGVVADVHANVVAPELAQPGIFRALVPGQLSRAELVVRVRGDDVPAYLARMRAVTAAVDPTLRLEPRVLREVYGQERSAVGLMGLVLGAVILSVLGLSAAGIYAMMSFTVTQRRREIALRAALGADPRRLLSGIFARSLRQLALGGALGIAAAVALNLAMEGSVFHGRSVFLVPAVCLVMMVVGMLAAVGPARRGLRIHPMEALRDQ